VVVRLGVVELVGDVVTVSVRVGVPVWVGVLDGTVADGVGVSVPVAVAVPVADDVAVPVGVGVGTVIVGVGLGPGVSVACVGVALAVAVCVRVLVAVGETRGVCVWVAVTSAVAVAEFVARAVGVDVPVRMRKRAMKSGALRRPSPLTSAVGHWLPSKTASVSATMSAVFARRSQLTSPGTLCAAATPRPRAGALTRNATTANPRKPRAGAGSRTSSPTSPLCMMDFADPGQPHRICRWCKVHICDIDGVVAIAGEIPSRLISLNAERFAASGT
jgi:hypothetical protein